MAIENPFNLALLDSQEVTRNLQVLSSLHLHVMKILICKTTSLHAPLSALSMSLISLQESLMSLKTDISWIIKSKEYRVNIPRALPRILKKWIEKKLNSSSSLEGTLGYEVYFLSITAMMSVSAWDCLCVSFSGFLHFNELIFINWWFIYQTIYYVLLVNTLGN